jgi:hypothetical protein
MAEVKIEDVVDHLESYFTKALIDTMNKFCPGAMFDNKALFKFFLRRIYDHCSVWEKVPDKCVKA